MGARRGRAGSPRRSTRPSRWARCSTSARSTTRACGSRRGWRPRRCWTPARRSSARSGAVQAGEDGYVKDGPRAIDVDVLLLGRRDVLVGAADAAAPRGDDAAVRARAAARARPAAGGARAAGCAADALERARRARTCAAPARRWTWVRDAARRRRRQHPDAPRRLRRGRARPRLALRHRARVDRRRARRGADATCSRCAGIGFADIDASIVSATVPSLRPQWTAMAQRYLGHEMLLVGPGLKTGMPIRYDNPREIGPDRLVNAVAGYERVGRGVRDRRLRHRRHPRRRQRGRRVPRRRDLPGRRDLAGGAVARAPPRCRRST